MLPKDMVKGTIHKTLKYGQLEVLEYYSLRKVIVRFSQTGHIAEVFSTNIRTGSVRDPYYPIYFGVGYLGEGPYTLREDRPAFTKWKNMLERCYGERYLYGSYLSAEVSADWHNFQNFAEWINGQPNAFTRGYELDKDILSNGKNLYSPDTCMVVTKERNLAERGDQ